MSVLLRFRKEEIAVTAHIEQMIVIVFYRNLLRVLWFEDNDLNKKMYVSHECRFRLREDACDHENHDNHV